MQSVLGVVRMAGDRSPLRALRPVFLAGAAALTWLTFSASTASADTLSDATTLLGGVTGSVSSVTEKLPVAPAPATPKPEPVSSPGLLTPLVGDASGLADQLVYSVPVVNHVVPAEAVSVISVPIAQAADAAAAEVTEAVISPVAEALPVLDPVLQPVLDLVTGSAPLAVELPDLPLVSGDGESPASAGTVPAGVEAASTAPTSAIPFVEAASATGVAPVGGVALASSASWTSVDRPDSAQDQPTADPSPAPSQAPAVPASGTGSSAASAGSYGAAAWLSAFNFDTSAPGAIRAADISDHAPAPVSFDPGSRPD